MIIQPRWFWGCMGCWTWQCSYAFCLHFV